MKNASALPHTAIKPKFVTRSCEVSQARCAFFSSIAVASLFLSSSSPDGDEALTSPGAPMLGSTGNAPLHSDKSFTASIGGGVRTRCTGSVLLLGSAIPSTGSALNDAPESTLGLDLGRSAPPFPSSTFSMSPADTSTLAEHSICTSLTTLASILYSCPYLSPKTVIPSNPPILFLGRDCFQPVKLMGFLPVPPASQKSDCGILSGELEPPRNCGKVGVRIWIGVTRAGWLMRDSGRPWERALTDTPDDKECFERQESVVVNLVACERSPVSKCVSVADELDAKLAAALHKCRGSDAVPFIFLCIFATLSGVTSRAGGRSSSLSSWEPEQGWQSRIHRLILKITVFVDTLSWPLPPLSLGDLVGEPPPLSSSRMPPMLVLLVS